MDGLFELAGAEAVDNFQLSGAFNERAVDCLLKRLERFFHSDAVKIERPLLCCCGSGSRTLSELGRAFLLLTGELQFRAVDPERELAQRNLKLIAAIGTGDYGIAAGESTGLYLTTDFDLWRGVGHKRSEIACDSG